jgi:capsular polysaccharide biosynthesis protein
MTSITKVASLPAGVSTVDYPLIYQRQLIDPQVFATLNAIWSKSYGGERVDVYHIEDVWVAGMGVPIDADGRVLEGFEPQFEADRIEALDSYGRHVEGGHEATVEDDCMVLIKRGYWNYGHWLVELLSQYLILRAHLPSIKPALYLAQGLPAAMLKTCEDSLRLLGSAEVEIRNWNWIPRRLKSLYVVKGHALHGPFHSKEIYDRLRAGLAPAEAKRRLYVWRPHVVTRNILNEADVRTVLVHHGFEEIDPGTLTFAEQRREFAQSAITIGVAGAALTNVAWQAPGSICLALYPSSMQDTFFWWMCQRVGVRFIDFRCPVAQRGSELSGWDGDITVDAAALDWLVSRLVTGEVPSTAQFEAR